VTVTCFCPTQGKRRAWLPQAIRCWESQTYEDKRLLIVSDGEDMSDLIPSDQRIQHVHLAARPATAGDKFNRCVELCETEIVCKWDDDDWSAPGRLSEQMARLLVSGKAVTGYNAMLFTDGRQWWKYPGPPNFALGTSLMFTRSWWSGHKFWSVQMGSDMMFQAAASAAKQVASVDAGSMMVASVHTHFHTSMRITSHKPYVKLLHPPVIPGYTWNLAT
jgi:hypothetical protein